ncbi:MAG: type II secretion system F family protein [Opitutales bacterium]
MLEAGLPLVNAMGALEEQMENLFLKAIIRDVRSDVASGNTLSKALKKYPNAFPRLFVSMVEAGEASGTLGEIMGKIAVYIQETVNLNKKVKGALTYPVVVIGLALSLIVVLMIFVIPVFSQMFADFGSELPGPTLFLIGISNFLKANIIFILIGAAGAFYFIRRFFRTPQGRVFKDKLIQMLPIVGALSKKINLSRFCRTYSILLKSGVPVLQSLEICASISNNTYIEGACRNFAKQVSSGGQLSDAIAEASYFPSLVGHMSKAGEQSGNIDDMMNKIADFYDIEVNSTIDSLSSLIEPFLITTLGIIIGGIVMAMFLPIFKLSSLVAQ